MYRSRVAVDTIPENNQFPADLKDYPFSRFESRLIGRGIPG